MEKIENRVKKLETMARASVEIPELERCQVVRVRKVNGEYVPLDPLDAVETRRKAIVDRYGTDEGVLYIQIIEFFGEPKNLETDINPLAL